LFLTRSLWRKMVFGLGMVLVMLTILSLSGIIGLISYRNVVNDPVFNVSRAPRQADLLAALASLQVALEPPSSPDALRDTPLRFPEAMERVREVIRRYRWRLDDLPPSNRAAVTQRMLSSIEAGLDALAAEYQQAGAVSTDPAASARLRRRVVPLLRTASYVPDSQDGFASRLRQARKAYRTSFFVVCVSSVVVLVLFAGLVGYGYRWIFSPLRQLHQGACRVAQGDFDYRLRLQTDDEMAELAEAFNQMTARFQEIANDLDRQVQERSRELVRSARLASVGFLAAGVAHEINNPLTAIKWTAESLAGRMTELLADAEEADRQLVQRYLDMVQKESLRCQQITAKLLDFARGQDATRVQSDLTALIREVLELVGHISKFRDRTIVFDRTDPCQAEVNPSEMKQVILNIVSNALESMEAGGRLEIELVEQTDSVVMVFRDDGCGMTPETLENLFEPFFTQKRDGKGTGLGLSISHRIVRDHGGRIEARSDGPGRGSTFRVFLPRRNHEQQSAA